MNVVTIVPYSTPPAPAVAWQHKPVMCAEVLTWLAPRPDGIYLDVTVGAGGHSAALLAAGAGRLIGIDRDDVALTLAAQRVGRDRDRVTLQRANFASIREVLDDLGIDHVDGLLADLGVSSMQLDQADRGMSFRHEGPLDMRMDRRQSQTARDLIASLDDGELTELLASLGEERRARRIARCIKQDMAAGRMVTTRDLRRAVIKAVGPARHGGVDPATRTFQALRMAVNHELGELAALLESAYACVRPGGVAAIMSFHSLEDRMVKRTFRDQTRWQPLSKKPIVAGELETDFNRRARSAKLRVAARREGEVLS